MKKEDCKCPCSCKTDNYHAHENIKEIRNANHTNINHQCSHEHNCPNHNNHKK